MVPFHHGGHGKQSPEIAGFFPQGDVMAPHGRDPGRLHACGPAADDEDLLFLLRRVDAHVRRAGKAVYPAPSFAAQAKVASCAWGDILRFSRDELVRQLRVCMEAPRHGDEIDQALPQGHLTEHGVHPSHDRDRDRHELLYGRGEEYVRPCALAPRVVFLGEVAHRDGGLRVKEDIREEPSHVPPQPVAPHLNGIGPCLGDQLGDGAAVLGRQARAVVYADCPPSSRSRL